MREQQQSAFLLHQRNYSETSLLLEVYTRRHGRIGLIAKGARRPSNRNRGLLVPFQPLLLGWSGRGELMVLTGVEAEAPALELAGRALYCGFYLNELLVRLLHRHDPHEALYDRYAAALTGLRTAPQAEEVLRVFEKHLLGEIGYGLTLERDSAGRALDAHALYDYVPEQGPVPVRHPELGGRVQGVRVRGASLLALAAERFEREGASLREIKALTRAALAPHLGSKPLQSRRLFLNRAPGIAPLAEETGP